MPHGDGHVLRSEPGAPAPGILELEREASLAHELAVSRSAFAARFTEVVGEPVMSYVARWRMQVAVAALRGEGAAVAQLAGRLGYRTEAAFSRAFKRVTGVSPGVISRSRHSPPAVRV